MQYVQTNVMAPDAWLQLCMSAQWQYTNCELWVTTQEVGGYMEELAKPQNCQNCQAFIVFVSLQ